MLRKHLAVVLTIFPRKRQASILDLNSLRVRIADINELEPFDPDGGGGNALPLPVFTNEEINELNQLIDINGGSLDTHEILYRHQEQLVVFRKVMLLRESLTQTPALAYV